ncbi:MAG TPA: hypothetical protein VH497_14130 [Vicinamibacterales bacterium]|jgi:hypothetical protein
MGDFYIVFVLAGIGALAVWIMMTVLQKTGHNPLLGLLAFLPIVNVALLVWLAFSEWPIQVEVSRLKAEVASLRGSRN